VAERDRAAVGVRLLGGEAELLLPGQHDRGEGLVDLADVHVVDAEAGALEQALRGVDRAGEHEDRVDAHEAGVDDAGAGSQAERLGASRVHQEHGGCAVGDLRRRAGGVHPVGASDRLQLGQLLERRLPQALVARHGVGGAGGLALLVDVGSVDRDDLGAEAILGPRGRRVLLRPVPEGVRVLAGDAPLVGDALGPLELRGHLVLREVRLRDRDAEAEVLAAARADRHPAHHLDASGDRRIDDPTGDQAGGEVRRLLRRTALRVDRGVRHREGQAGGEPRGPADVEGLLADLAHTARDDLADQLGIDPGSFDDRLLDGSQEVGGVDAGQATPSATHGGADGFDDHDVRHGGNLPVVRADRRPGRRVLQAAVRRCEDGAEDSSSCRRAIAACRLARASAMPLRPTSLVASESRQTGGVSRRVS
jgi:hypothetical protein